jgi:quinol monooxygenase YgiN
MRRSQMSRGGQVMLIRVATTRANIPQTGEGIAFVHGEIEPKIAAMDGNRGFALTVDHSFGRYVGIAAWTDPEALEASGHDAPGMIADLAWRLHGSKPTLLWFVKPLRRLIRGGGRAVGRCSASGSV